MFPDQKRLIIPLRSWFWFLVFLSVWVHGCTSSGLQDMPEPTHTQPLVPYRTGTVNPTPPKESPAWTSTPEPAQEPTATPTPFTYLVVADDTLTGIAFKHSVELEDLIAANPGIDPNFLTIGMTLTIPLEGVQTSVLPTATPVPVEVLSPACYPLSDGGLQCLSIVENHQEFPVENVNVIIVLEPSDGGSPIEQIATMPLNVLPPKQIGIVSATFPPPFPRDFNGEASLLSAIPVSAEDQRYLPTELQLQDQTISSDGCRADISGVMKILSGESQPGLLWVVVLAFDAENNIVGFRKWSGGADLINGNQADFQITVYCLGPPINNIEVLSEARP